MSPVHATVLRLVPPALLLAATGLPACAAPPTARTAPPGASQAASPDALPAAASVRGEEPVCDPGALPAGAPTMLAEVVVPALDEASLDAWAAHLAPSADELSWEAVDWLPSYAQGVAAAQEQRRPILLWAMNGHPLGCT